MEQERTCIVCNEIITGDYIILPSTNTQVGGVYHTGDKQHCGPGSINWLKKFGLGKFGQVLYRRKGGMSMNEPCPEFGKGFSEGAKECKACMVVNSTYAGECKKETTAEKEGGESGIAKVKKAKRDGGKSYLGMCLELISIGTDKEACIREVKKAYIAEGKDEVFALKRAKSVYSAATRTR